MSKRSRKVAFQEDVDIADKKHKEGQENGKEATDTERSRCALIRVQPLASLSFLL